MKPCRNCGEPTARSQPHCAKCEFMTRTEAAERLRVSMSTIVRLVGSGKLHPRKIGLRKMLIRRTEVDAILG